MSSLQKKETLLIVDDSKFQRVVIRQSLGEHFNFAEAVSGEECLTIMEKESDAIDLVLLDLVMPGIDGFEVLRRRQKGHAGYRSDEYGIGVFPVGSICTGGG